MSRVVAERRRAGLPEKESVRPQGWMHGLSGDAVIGFAAGLVVYCTGAADVPPLKLIGAAIIAGVSGAAYFVKTEEVKEARRQASRESAKSKVFKGVSEKALEQSIKVDANAAK